MRQESEERKAACILTVDLTDMSSKVRQESDERGPAEVGPTLGTGGIVDMPGERDGCDRCGCPDEERCCPFFWNDPGIPDLPVLRWVFDPNNPYLNDNRYCRMFGNFGYKFCDRERKAFMGTALAVTVVAIVITGIGAFSVSTDPVILQFTSWAATAIRNDGKNGQVMFIGLRQVVIRNCSDSSGNVLLDWDDCEETIIPLVDVGCSSGEEDFFGYDCDVMAKCAENAAGNFMGALITFATLLLAMNGCLTRIKKVADTNLQKILGALPDTSGVISLAITLWVFKSQCYDPLPSNINREGGENDGESGGNGGNGNDSSSSTASDVDNYLWTGWLCYVYCWFAAIIRCTMHYLTPVPGGGQGCYCMDTIEQMTGIDFNNDGEIGTEEGRKELEMHRQNIKKVKSGLKMAKNHVKSAVPPLGPIGKKGADNSSEGGKFLDVERGS